MPPLPARAPPRRRGAHGAVDGERRPLVAEGEDGAPAETGLAAIAPRVAADRYGLAVIAEDIADHAGNQTRFVVVAREGIPRRTGNDRTGLVVYQRADAPGSLVSILQEFAARRINLSNLLSRPTKDGGLGDYCFVDLRRRPRRGRTARRHDARPAPQAGRVKFLGSYPAAGPAHAEGGDHHDVRWNAAQDWVASLQAMIERARARSGRPSAGDELGVEPPVAAWHRPTAWP